MGFLRRAAAKREVIVAIAVFLALTAVTARLKTYRIDLMGGDSAMMFQATYNIAHRGVPESGIYESTKVFRDSNIVVTPAAAIAKAPLSAPPVAEGNLFELHTYFILYPLALVAAVLPVEAVLETAFAVAFVALLAMAYIVLRRRGVPALAACLLLAVIAGDAAWSEALLSGQFFPDRLFVPCAFLLMILVSRPAALRWSLVAAAVLCTSVTERAGPIAAIGVLAYVLLYVRSTRDRAFKVLVALCMLGAGIALMHVANGEAVANTFLPRNVPELVGTVQDPAFLPRFWFFVEMSAPLLLIALFEWRAALVAVVTMLPNVFGNIGGAEKTGWSTHYHSYYLPFLVWAAVQGYTRLYRVVAARRLQVALYAAVAVLALAANSVDPDAASANVPRGDLANSFFVRLYREAITYSSAGAPDFPAIADAIRTAVPPGSTVSSPEGTMSELYRDRTVYYLPVGLDGAGYAILGYSQPVGGAAVYSGVPSYLGADESAKVQNVIVERMRRDGYDFEHPVLVPAIGIAVFHRARATGR